MNDYWACNFDDPDSVMPYSWTTEPPTREGLWRSCVEFKDGRTGQYWEHVIFDGKQLFLLGASEDVPLEEYINDPQVAKVFWLGPLPEPQPPKG